MHCAILLACFGFLLRCTPCVVVSFWLFCAPPALLAQGAVRLANNDASAITNWLTQSRLLPGRFTVALYYMPDQSSPPASADFDRGAFPCRPWAGLQAPGIFGDGLRTTPTNTAPGDWAWFQVRAWETAYGASYEEAFAADPRESPPEGAAPTVGAPGRAATSSGFRRALVGTSNIIRVRTGATLDPTNLVGFARSAYPPASPALTDFGLQGFVLFPQPAISSLRVDPLISFDTLTGLLYAVEKTVSLDAPAWELITGAPVPGTGGPVSVSDPGAGCVDARYYRIRVVP